MKITMIGEKCWILCGCAMLRDETLNFVWDHSMWPRWSLAFWRYKSLKHLVFALIGHFKKLVQTYFTQRLLEIFVCHKNNILFILRLQHDFFLRSDIQLRKWLKRSLELKSSPCWALQLYVTVQANFVHLELVETNKHETFESRNGLQIPPMIDRDLKQIRRCVAAHLRSRVYTWAETIGHFQPPEMEMNNNTELFCKLAFSSSPSIISPQR